MSLNTIFYTIKTLLTNSDSSVEKSVCFFFDILLQNQYSITCKFYYFILTIENIFITSNQREMFIDLFCKAQKTYFYFTKLALNFKYKKSKIIVDTDLSMNPLNKNSKTTICIYQDNNRYLFNIFDLVNIITKNLSNSTNFFPEPLITKNPYNNIPFNKSTLYNIFFHLREKLFIVPELFNKFFYSHFNLKDFTNDNEYLIREYSIENYINNTFTDILYKNVIFMLRDYNNIVSTKYKIFINKDFSKKKLVDIMRPYLKLYYIRNGNVHVHYNGKGNVYLIFDFVALNG